MRKPVAVVTSSLAVSFAFAACGSEPPPCASVASAAPPASASASLPVARPKEERDTLAVMPLDEDELFRDERAELRRTLRDRLVVVAPEVDVLPIAYFDAKLRSVSASGARCGYESYRGTTADIGRVLDQTGWLTTNTGVLYPSAESRQEEIEVDLVDRTGPHAVSFSAPWPATGDAMGRYRAGIAALQRLPETRGMLGMIGALGMSGEATAGAVRFCEHGSMGACSAESAQWKDSAPAIAACWKDDGEADARFLVGVSNDAPKCEIANLDDAGGVRGKREACVCKALLGSNAAKRGGERRGLTVKFLAPELEGKAKPEMRVVEVSSNLTSETDYQMMSGEKDARETRSIHRLIAGDLDVVGARLAACGLTPSSTVIAELAVSDAGVVTSARVVGGDAGKARECVEKALARATFPCTEDGKGGSVKVAMFMAGGKHG